MNCGRNLKWWNVGCTNSATNAFKGKDDVPTAQYCENHYTDIDDK